MEGKQGSEEQAGCKGLQKLHQDKFMSVQNVVEIHAWFLHYMHFPGALFKRMYLFKGKATEREGESICLLVRSPDGCSQAKARARISTSVAFPDVLAGSSWDPTGTPARGTRPEPQCRPLGNV